MVFVFLFLGIPGGSEAKESDYNAGDLGSIPGSGRSPGKGNGNPLQYSCLENSMDRGAWWATVHRVAKSRIQLTDFTNGDMKNRLMDMGRGEDRAKQLCRKVEFGWK